jgi:IS5 family transposase
VGRILRVDRTALPEGGQRPAAGGAERMLRMYCIANWFNLSDEACEDALYDVPVFREFCRIDLGQERVPDATTLMNFRHLLELINWGRRSSPKSANCCWPTA